MSLEWGPDPVRDHHYRNRLTGLRLVNPPPPPPWEWRARRSVDRLTGGLRLSGWGRLFHSVAVPLDGAFNGPHMALPAQAPRYTWVISPCLQAGGVCVYF